MRIWWRGCGRMRRTPGDAGDGGWGRGWGACWGWAGITVGQGRGLGGASVIGGVRQAVLAVDASTRRITVGAAVGGAAGVGVAGYELVGGAAGSVRCTVKLRARETPHGALVVPDAGGDGGGGYAGSMRRWRRRGRLA